MNKLHLIEFNLLTQERNILTTNLKRYMGTCSQKTYSHKKCFAPAPCLIKQPPATQTTCRTSIDIYFIILLVWLQVAQLHYTMISKVEPTCCMLGVSAF